MKALKVIVIFILLPFGFLEVWARHSLFDHVSYTKSASLDSTLKDLKASSRNDVFFFGDSEVRWGVTPLYFDETLRQGGVNIQSFNFGIDGFSSGLNLSMVEKIGATDFKGITVALIGVQLIEYNQPFDSDERIRVAAGGGALQRPIFLSSYGVDKKLRGWASEDHSLLDRFPLALFRYRASIKEYFTFAKKPYAPYTNNGFQPHVSIAANPDNYQGDIKNKANEKLNEPKNYEPLDKAAWERTLEKDMYFDKYATLFLKQNVLPVFFALPTNPWLIDFKNRRQNYKDNSMALKEWGAQNGLSFIDLGILDNFSSELDFADFRHLSFRGAAKFSDNLAQEILKTPQIRSYLGKSDVEKKVVLNGILNKCSLREYFSPQKIQKDFVVDYDISSISVINDFLLIKASGNDSRLILPNLKSFIEKDLVLELSIETNADTTFTTSWSTENSPSFNNKMTIEHTLRAGINNLSLDISADSKIKSIRIDPGQTAGEYKIYSLSYSSVCK